MLSSLDISNIGPAKNFQFRFGPRFNFFTGDNGLGKTFLLEAIWWTLTGSWSGRPLRPKGETPEETFFEYSWADSREPAISFYGWRNGRWQTHYGTRPDDTGLVIYARVDGGFSIALSRQAERGRPRTPLHLSPSEVWEGSAKGRKVKCEGFYRDVTSWLQTKTPEGAMLREVAHMLSPKAETLALSEPERVYVDEPRNHPMLQMPYGKIPVAEASAGMRRILSLAYVLTWASQEERERSRLAGGVPTRDVTLIIDEVEAHLHPKWQRSIVPSLIPALSLSSSRTQGVQVFATTHSPMLLASLEPHFDEEQDNLFLFSLREREKTVTAEKMKWAIRGNAAYWLTSVFGLREARSNEAEQAIDAAKAYMENRIQDLPERLKTKEEIHEALKKTLGGQDPFWPRWMVKTGMED